MLEILRQWARERAGRAGRRLALEEFENIAAGTWSAEKAAEYRGQANGDNDFRHGWIGGWTDIGARDASKGISRADEFQNPAYLTGWQEKVRELQMAGWHHAVLDSRPDTPTNPARRFCGGAPVIEYQPPGPLSWDD
jgi:hypothetical protein